MIGVIITGHGKISSGIYESLKMIYGVNENIKYLDFLESDTSDNLKSKIYNAIDELLQKNDAVLCLTDIQGGTPFKTCAELSITNDKVGVISGLNLPMLISTVAEMSTLSLEEALELAVNDGKNEINKFVFVAKENENTNNFEDGI